VGGSEVAERPERATRPIRRPPPQRNPWSIANRAGNSKEIDMNDYDVLCKGTVIIGSLLVRDVRS
jgi:hypothetical protein